jgi:hypothetical protein
LLTSSVVFGLTTICDLPWYLFIQSSLNGWRSSVVADPSKVESSDVGEESNERRWETWDVVATA